jgi:polyhydroxyalkanoate synthesis regulator phasin
MTEIAAKANALFQFLVNSGELTQADEDTQERIDKLKTRKYELEKELEDNPDPAPAMVSQIEQINEELEEIEKEYSDVYDLENQVDEYLGHLVSFYVEKIEQSYAVGDEYDMENAALQYLEQLYDDIGFDSLPDWVLEESIDTDSVVEYVRDIYNQVIYESPEVYLNDEDRELSSEQKYQYQKLLIQIRDIEIKVKGFEIAKKNEKDEDKLIFIDKSLSRFNKVLSSLKENSQGILSDPEGDFSEESIEKEIESRLEMVEEIPLQTVREFDLYLKDFLDENKVYETILQNDGFTVMSSYTGDVNEEIVNGDLFYIFRIE